MSNHEFHARNEFRAAGWVDENGKFKDEMECWMKYKHEWVTEENDDE